MKRILLILFAASTLAAAVHAKEGGRHGFPPRGPWMEDALELPKEKQEAVCEVMERWRKDASDLHDRLKVALSKLQWQVDAKADPKDLTATLDEAGKAREALRKHFEKTRAEIDGLLTPEQRARMLLAYPHPGPGFFGPRGMRMPPHGMEGPGAFGPGRMPRGPIMGKHARPAPGDDDVEAGPDERENEE